MKESITLWLLVFHVLFFVALAIKPFSSVELLLWMGLLSAGAVSLPIVRRHLETRSVEIAALNILLVILHLIWMMTGISQENLSFIFLALIGSAALALNQISRRSLIDLDKLDLPFLSVVFAVAFVVLSQTLQSSCAALATDFDSQNYLTWAYTAYKNYLPYKDVVYWYGLLTYYAASLGSVKVVTIAWSLMVFTGLAVVAARLIKDKGFLSLFLLLLLAVIRGNSGYPAFLRYGTSFALAIISSYVLSRKVVSRTALMVLGVVSAAMMFLISDQGIYFTLIVAAQIFLREVFGDAKSTQKIAAALWQRYVWFGLGFGLTWLMALSIMDQLGALHGYWENIQAMGMMSIFAKVSLSELLFSKENILTTITLFIGTQLLIYQSFFSKTKPKGFLYLLNAGWLLTLWLCQNKFLIRPWFETQFVFITFVFYSVQVLQQIREITGKMLSQTSQTVLAASFVLGFFSILAPDKSVIDLFVTAKNHYVVGYAELLKPPGFNHAFTTCVASYFQNFNKQVPTKYTAALEWIIDQPALEKPKIFSFPGEPIFYLLHNQKPPAFFNAYDASSYAAQHKNLDYLRENNVSYVIWDTDNIMIQDNVPNILRNNLVVEYILSHFEAKQQVGNFLIFQRTMAPDNFLKNQHVTANREFYNSLTQLNLKFYPVLLEKKMKLQSRQTLMKFSTDSPVVIPNDKTSNSVFLWISTTTNVPVELELTTETQLKTNLTMTSCYEKKPCLIPLHQLPVFYNPANQFSIKVKTSSPWRAEVVTF